MPQGRHERRFPNGVRITLYPNGTAREVIPPLSSSPESPDVEESFVATVTRPTTGHASATSGLSLLKSPQPGSIFYYFPNGNLKLVCPNGNVHYVYPSGVRCSVESESGLRTYYFPSGQIEKYYGSRWRLGSTEESRVPFLYHEIIYPDGTRAQKMTNGSVSNTMDKQNAM